MRCGVLRYNTSLLFLITQSTTQQFVKLAQFWYGDVLTHSLFRADEFLKWQREVERARTGLEGVMRELNNINHIH